MYSASGSITTTNLPNTVYTYDAAGNLHSEVLPDGITQTYGYDSLNRLTTETVTEGSNNLASFTYSLSTNGQRLSEIDNQYNTAGTLLYTNTYNWSYDGDNRLKTETLTAGSGSPDTSYTDTYTYDNVGNRLTKTHVVGTSTLSITDTYDSHGDNRLMTETATGANAYTTTYSYDNNGSLISEVRTGSGATTNNYTYDVQNHLIIANIGGMTTDYTYDADGNRASSTQGSTTTYFTIDDINPTGNSQILEEATSFSGTPSTTYVSGLAVLGQANSSAALSDLVTDGHGSTRILADASGNVSDRYDYDAFGNALTSTAGTQILYDGQFFDSAIGQYYLRARNYDPTIGRFTSMDSFSGGAANPVSLNRFIYGGSNPIGEADPTGHQLLDILGAAGLDTLLSSLEFTAFSAVNITVRGVEAGLTANQIFEEFLIQQAEQVALGVGFAAVGKLFSALREGSLFASFAESGNVSAQEAVVVESEISNSFSNLGAGSSATNAAAINDFPNGSAFSGVYNPETGRFLAYPSGETTLASGTRPPNVVRQRGGHAIVNDVFSNLLGVDPTSNVGFTLFKEPDGTLSIEWLSRSVNGSNPSFAGNIVPISLRPQIIDSIESATGLTVSSAGV